MFKILISDKLGEDGLARLDQASDAAYDVKAGLSREELLATIQDYDALIVRSGTQVDTELLAAGKKLRVVGRAGIGVDNIDVRAATLRGVIVMNTPQANAIATAEHTLALILAASRHIAQAHASVLAGEWERNRFVGKQLYRKLLGIIGFGRIGRLVASRAQSFGMEVLAYDPFVSEEVARNLGVTLVDLDELLSQSDYVSLHLAQTAETMGIIDAEAIARMKVGAMLINAARGKLVDEAALAQALKRGHLRAAAVDVYSSEPPPSDHPLVGLPGVLHVPHLGASTEEAQRDVATQIVDQVLDALRGADFRNTINMPFVAGPEFDDIRPYMELAEKIGLLHAGLAESPVRRVEIEVRGETVDRMVKPIAAALLKGLLERSLSDPVNYINAPVLAEEDGIAVSQTKGMNLVGYPNLISCRVHTDSQSRLLSGVLFGSNEPRIVQVNEYHLEAKPEGIVLMMLNRDVPGVIGQVGTLLAAYNVNIGEWRMGRERPGSAALSFINLDCEPPEALLVALERIPAIEKVKLISL